MKKVYLILLVFLISCTKNKTKFYSGIFTGEEYICRSQVGGKVISFRYDEGNRVRKGDTLISIDDKEYKLSISSMEYKIKNLKIQLNNAYDDLQKAKSLYKGSAIPKEKYEFAKRKYQSLLLQLKSAKVELGAKKETLKNFLITAPTDGYISEKYIKEGEVAVPGAPLAEIIDPSKIYLSIFIPENEISKISINQPIKVKVDAFPDRSFKGRIVFISKQAEFTPKNIQTREERVFLVYKVKVLVKNPGEVIKPGIYGDAYLK